MNLCTYKRLSFNTMVVMAIVVMSYYHVIICAGGCVWSHFPVSVL